MSSLRFLREKIGITQQNVAEELSITQSAVSKWEKDETLPSTENLIKLAQLYKCSVDDLINEKPSH